ncbi:MAG: hypothetical protein RJA80_468, partial [Actinomycetota bacterium]
LTTVKQNLSTESRNPPTLLNDEGEVLNVPHPTTYKYVIT